MTKRKVFFSFHYEKDSWRASQIRNIGVVEGNEPASDNDWEEIKGDDEKIKKWIDEQLKGKSCAIVLIGEKTATRKWVEYEIEKAWDEGKGLLGIYIHNLKDKDGNQSQKGKNPFEVLKNLKDIVKSYDPPYDNSKYDNSKNVYYNYIKENIKNWIEEAIKIRNNY